MLLQILQIKFLAFVRLLPTLFIKISLLLSTIIHMLSCSLVFELPNLVNHDFLLEFFKALLNYIELFLFSLLKSVQTCLKFKLHKFRYFVDTLLALLLPQLSRQLALDP